MHEQHIRALEALQLSVPVSHALGLGSEFTELEELSFKALFPDTYGKFSVWHRRFMDNGQLALMMVSTSALHLKVNLWQKVEAGSLLLICIGKSKTNYRDLVCALPTTSNQRAL